MYRYSQKRIAIQYLSRANRGLPVYRYIDAPLPDVMPPYAAFHLGLHFCQSSCLPVSRMKRVDPLCTNESLYISRAHRLEFTN